MKFVDELPPTNQGVRWRLLTAEQIAELRANAGKWAVVKTYASSRHARSSADNFKRRVYYADLEFTVRDKTVYVRFPNGAVEE